MPSRNGHGPKRAILYARVSTDEQARSGYSLAQQLEALRAYCEREGYEDTVPEELENLAPKNAATSITCSSLGACLDRKCHQSLPACSRRASPRFVS
jgi:hypothetical protein